MRVIIGLALLLVVEDAVAATPLPFKEQCLKWHNHFRSKHQAADVTWSEDLEREAQAWAGHLAGYNKFEHSENFGENLYMFQGKSIEEACTEATKAFYSEITLYDFDKPGFSTTTGHFTQVVWKATSMIGAARANGSAERVIVVIRYSPPGNIDSTELFKQNVLPEVVSETADTATNSAKPLRYWPAVSLTVLTAIIVSCRLHG